MDKVTNYYQLEKAKVSGRSRGAFRTAVFSSFKKKRKAGNNKQATRFQSLFYGLLLVGFLLSGLVLSISLLTNDCSGEGSKEGTITNHSYEKPQLITQGSFIITEIKIATPITAKKYGIAAR